MDSTRATTFDGRTVLFSEIALLPNAFLNPYSVIISTANFSFQPVRSSPLLSSARHKPNSVVEIDRYRVLPKSSFDRLA